jgi:hypothetical protein
MSSMSADTSPTFEDAYSIWLRARSSVTSAQYPRRLNYTIAVSGLDGATRVADHYRASCDPSDGAIRIFPISDEELAKPPPVPRGVNVSFSIALCVGACAGVVIPVGRPPPPEDLLGEPLLDPTYMFGLRYSLQGRATSDGGAPLRVIATVSARAPDYTVALVDLAPLEGIWTYHLRLTPVRRPKDNRLRELWIGTQDFLPRRVIVAGNFTLAPLVDVPWSIDFSVIDGAPYITSESTASTLYLPHHRVVKGAAISFQDIRAPDGKIYDQPLVDPEKSDGTLVEPL